MWLVRHRGRACSCLAPTITRRCSTTSTCTNLVRGRCTCSTRITTCAFEVPTTVARVALFGDAALRPMAEPHVDVITILKPIARWNGVGWPGRLPYLRLGRECAGGRGPTVAATWPSRRLHTDAQLGKRQRTDLCRRYLANRTSKQPAAGRAGCVVWGIVSRGQARNLLTLSPCLFVFQKGNHNEQHFAINRYCDSTCGRGTSIDAAMSSIRANTHQQFTLGCSTRARSARPASVLCDTPLRMNAYVTTACQSAACAPPVT